MIDRTLVNAIDKDIQAAIKEIADKHGLVIVPTRGSFTNTSFRKTIEFAVKSESGVPQQLVDDFSRYANMFGLSGVEIGTEFTARNKVYRIAGLEAKKRKKPFVIIEVATNTTYNCDADYIKAFMALGNQKQ